ncbi:ABC transporter six-transmembrane domain-containing protein [Flagellimonas flava]|uniref:ABC transporter transmembrane region n=1 Tax=Flagellimonas flava TaxID=570519 RepID=A0A1M5IJ15_9FLAO|nr:ABC transporter six-transmembrane domain-containing protein [Allomuricauda flava]SHG28251.1 ABC transporter transmembrane region [Allomuricauda flava]
MSPRKLFYQYKWRFTLTYICILGEAALLLLFPWFIGNAIDDVLSGHFKGAFNLGFLGILLLVVGVVRRVFDSRFYAEVYREAGVTAMVQIQGEKVSVKTARLHMLAELVEFLENTLPELINTLIGLVGVMCILLLLNQKVFWGGVLVTGMVVVIYALSSKKTIFFNEQANDELERQVEVISQKNTVKLGEHLKRMMRWNIKLSDLEALNFSLSWIVALAFLVLSIIVGVGDGIDTYGALFALVMYVFQYIESVLQLPVFYQNWLRLHEILARLRQGGHNGS